MSAAGFNTLETADDLRAAGLNEAHARAIVSTVYRAMSKGLATKEHVSAEIAALRSGMPKTAIGFVAANVTVTVALLKLLP